MTIGEVIEMLKAIFNFIMETFGGYFSGIFGGDAEEEGTQEPTE